MTILTVCIPVHNGADSVERAIRSIHVDEVDGAMEILVCDDGSTDDTWAVLERLAGEIPELRLLRNPTNLGRPATRNRVMHEATGRFLTWLDADDEKYPGMLAAQLRELARIENEEGEPALASTLVYTNYHWRRAGWTRPKLKAPDEPADPMRALLDASFGGYLWLMMGLRSTLLRVGAFDESLPRLQDLDFFIRFAEIGGRFRRVPETQALCAYDKVDAGRDTMAVWRSWTRIWRRHRHHFTAYGMANARHWRRHHYRVARRYARANGDKVTYARIVVLEVWFVVRGRFRRLIFDA